METIDYWIIVVRFLLTLIYIISHENHDTIFSSSLQEGSAKNLKISAYESFNVLPKILQKSLRRFYIDLNFALFTWLVRSYFIDLKKSNWKGRRVSIILISPWRLLYLFNGWKTVFTYVFATSQLFVIFCDDVKWNHCLYFPV